MASLTLRGDTWHIAYRVNGQVRRKTTGCKKSDRIGAEIALREFEDEQRLNRKDPYRQHRKQPITAHLADFCTYREAQGITKKQIGEVRARIERLLDICRFRRLDDISEEKVLLAVSKLRRVPLSKKQKQNPDVMPRLATRTRNQYLQAIQTFTRWATRNRRMESDPLTALKKENEAVDIRHPRTVMTDEQFAKLYRAAMNSEKTIDGLTGPERASVYLLAGVTGLRRKELANLTPRSFRLDGDDPVVIVDAAWAKARRTDAVKLNAQAVAEIRRILAAHEGDGPLFPRLDKRRTCWMIEHDLKAAGLEYRTPEGFRDLHSIRHCFVTRLGRLEGVKLKEVQKLARHADVRTTARYLHALDKELRAVVDRLPDLPLESPGEDAA